MMFQPFKAIVIDGKIQFIPYDPCKESPPTLKQINDEIKRYQYLKTHCQF